MSNSQVNEVVLTGDVSSRPTVRHAATVNLSACPGMIPLVWYFIPEVEAPFVMAI